LNPDRPARSCSSAEKLKPAHLVGGALTLQFQMIGKPVSEISIAPLTRRPGVVAVPDQLSEAISYSGLIRALLQLSKRAAGQSAKFSRGGVEFRGVVGAARLERDEPAAEAVELIRRQLGHCFGDFFHFHVPQYSTAWGLVERWNRIGAPWSRVTSDLLRSPAEAPLGRLYRLLERFSDAEG
jgi:hypothetical protein